MRGVKRAAWEGEAAATPPCIISHCHILCPPARQGVGSTALAAAAFTFPREQEMKGRSTRSPAPSLGVEPQLEWEARGPQAK